MKKLLLLVGAILLSGLSLSWAETVEFKGSVGIDGNVDVTGQYEIDGKQVLDQGNSNLYLGLDAGKGTVEPDAAANTYLGIRSGAQNNYGSFNTYVGALAGWGVTTHPSVMADNNVFVGYSSCPNIQGGDDNVVIGYQSATDINDGYQNVLIGSEVGSQLTGGFDNVMIGYSAGQGASEGDSAVAVTGISNVLIGSFAGQDIGTGGGNVFIGHRSGEDNTTGSNNVYLGLAAGWYNQTGSGNIFIGHKAGSEVRNVSNQLFIDNSDTLDPLIWGDFENKKVIINGNLWVEGWVKANSCCPSDVRLKENVVPLGNVLAKVMAMKGVRYNWKPGTPEAQFYDGNDARIGVVAQDVEKVFPELVGENSNGFKTVDYQKLVAPLIEAVKELKTQKDREIAVLKAEKDKQIEELNARLQALEERLE